LATGVDAGSTTIRATVDGKSGTATLKVTEPPPPRPVVDRVSVSPSSASIEEGKTQQFSATAYTSDNVAISGKTFTWSSSSTSVATVNSSGLATGVDAGSTTIRATVDGKSGTATLTVTGPLRSRTGTIGGRNNYSSGGSVTLSETSDGKLRLSIAGLSTPSGAPDVFVALYTSNNINWPRNGALPAGAVEFGEVSRQSGNKAWTFSPASGKNIDSWSHLILHCRLINREVGSASLGN
ncbi:MAG: Ig-like domain-containing protein, partial [Gemmatimonadota bacterium]|nr:Ig-like domain-containing protein [Gemmatimonadota bacterium]